MDYAGFLRQVARGPVPGVALLHGPDPQLLDDALGAVSRALFPDPALALLDREVLEARETDAEAIVRSALTFPLQARARLVAVRRCQGLPARGQEALAAYCAGPNPTTCLLLLADEPLGAGRDRKGDHWLLGAVPPAAVVALGARRGRGIEAWLRERAAAEGLGVSEEAARLVVEWVGEDGGQLLGEVRKAALAGGPDNQRVGVEEVRAVVGEHRLHGVYELTRAIERGEAGAALRVLDRLLATEEPVLLLAHLTREARTAWAAVAAREAGQGSEQIARALRRPLPVVEGILSAPGASAERLGRAMRRCWEVERRLKSGGQARAELALLVAELCAGA
jgi:DNA polymerase III delta subunit